MGSRGYVREGATEVSSDENDDGEGESGVGKMGERK